ncbi:MAG: OpgC domain-containing protein [Proteobacteria bacterium]|nr:OpgC domain-containing protein [Pseudomonadota bacterium]
MFRGIVILDMILIHFDTYFPTLVRKLLHYFDFAMDGFLFAAGLMIGAHYFDRFCIHPNLVARRIWYRTLELYGYYLLIVFTIIAPFYYVVLDFHDSAFFRLIVELILVKKQVGIAHILPTFIPLFLTAPLILWLIANRRIFWVLIASFVLFLVGLHWPYLFSYADEPIFPVIIWQAYFCIGLFFGMNGFVTIEKIARSRKFAVLVNTAFLLLAVLKFGTSQIPLLETLRAEYGLFHFRRFPLNMWGFMFGISLVFLVLHLVYRFFNVIKFFGGINTIVERFGRHSLLVFVVHAYFVYLALAIAKLTGSVLWPSAIFGACLFSLVLITRQIERERSERRRSHPGVRTE